MLDHGYEPDYIEDDGKIHRFDAPDEKRGRKSAWYVCHGTHGAFGDWVSGLTFPWHEAQERRGYSDAETKVRDAEEYAKAAKRFNQAEKDRLKATEKVNQMILDSEWLPAKMHDYVRRKKLNIGSVLALGTRILIPLINVKGDVVSLQYIFPDGDKRFVKHINVQDCYHVIGSKMTPDGKTTHRMMYLTEGWATGCTIHEVTGKPVVVAFSAGNLKGVADMWKSRGRLVVAADNDHATRVRGKLVNTGMNTALDVCETYHLDFTIPIWDKPGSKVTDFNDLYCVAGAKECRRQLKQVVKL